MGNEESLKILVFKDFVGFGAVVKMPKEQLRSRAAGNIRRLACQKLSWLPTKGIMQVESLRDERHRSKDKGEVLSSTDLIMNIIPNYQIQVEKDKQL